MDSGVPQLKSFGQNQEPVILQDLLHLHFIFILNMLVCPMAE